MFKSLKMWRQILIMLVCVGLILGAGLLPWTAWAQDDPQISLSTAQIDQALWCSTEEHLASQPGVGDQTVLLLPGANNTGMGVWAWSYAAQLPADGIRACTLDFPHHNTEDLQISGQYVAGAVARLRQRYPHTRLSIVAHSLGNLSALWALHYRPRFMADQVYAYVAIGAPFQSTPHAVNCSAASPCQPAAWEAMPGSRFLQAVNSSPLPQPIHYLSVVSVNDEIFGDQWRRYTAWPKGTQGLQIGIQELCTSDQVAGIGHVQEVAVKSIYLLAKDVILNRPMTDVARSACTAEAYAHMEALGLEWTVKDGGNPAHLGDAPKVAQEPPLRSQQR